MKKPPALSSRQSEHSAVGTQHSFVATDADSHPERSEGSAFRRFAGTLITILREIFDENAYARFLARHRMANTREAYALYLRESNVTRERRPRCC